MNEIAENFKELAQEYCAIIERSDTVSLAEFVSECSHILAALYHIARELPAVEPEGEDDMEPSLSSDTIIHLSQSLGRLFGEFNLYRVPVHPYVSESLDDAVSYGMLGDDFADIYRELKAGLECYTDNSVLAIWLWRFSFQIHWGRHALNALWALDRLTHKQDVRT